MADRIEAKRDTPRGLRWAGYAAAAWALLFAVRGVYWALGGTVGLGTLSDGIQRAAAAGDSTLFGALWAVVGLLIFGALMALATVRPWGHRLLARVPLLGRWSKRGAVLVLGTAGAGGLLLVHGLGYVSLLVTAELAAAEVRWYALLWGPWFTLGGVLFLLAALGYRRRELPGRLGGTALALGAAGGALAGLAPTLLAAVAGGT